MAFFDNFLNSSGSNEFLSDHTPDGGTAWTPSAYDNDGLVVLDGDGFATNFNNGLCFCDDQGTADHYTIWTIGPALGDADAPNVYYCINLVDEDNFVASKLHGTQSAGLRLTKNVAGTTTDLITTQGVAGSDVRVEREGGTVRLYQDGAQVGSDQTVTDHQTETSQGIVSHGGNTVFAATYFEAGALAGGGTTEEASVSYAVSSDSGYTALVTAEGSSSFSASVDVAKSATATALGSITFPVSGGFSTTGQASREAATTAGVRVDDTVTAESIGEAEATMSVDVQVSDQYVAQAIANATTAQGVSAGQTFAAQIVAEASVAYGATAGYSTTGQAVTGGTFESTVTVSQDVTVAAAAEATAEASIVVTQELAANVIAEAAAAAGIAVGSVSDVSFTGTTVSGSVMTPDGRTLTISARIKTLTISAESRTLTIN